VSVIDSTPVRVDEHSAACVVKNTLYAVGLGRGENELWAGSAVRDEWTRYADLPSGRSRHCVSSVGNKIYVLGGWVHEGEKTVDSILCYDINSNTWTEASASVCHAVWSGACLTYKHHVYMFGGRDKDIKTVNHVQVYDTATGQVSLSFNPMPAAHDDIEAALWGSKALLLGRFTCYMYDFESGTWQERMRFKADGRPFGLTVADNTLYVLGGGMFNTLTDEVTSLSVDDFISDRWKAKWRHHAKLPRPVSIQVYSSVPLYRPM